MLFGRPIAAAVVAVSIPTLLIDDGELAARRLIDAAIDVQADHSFDAAVAPQVRAILSAPGRAGAAPSPDGFELLDRWVPGLGTEARAIAFHRPPAASEGIRWPER